MTEADWLACDDPQKLLEALRGKADDRKLRLLAAGCCRQIWNLLLDDRSREAVEAAERYADGDLGDDEREAAYREAGGALSDAGRGPDASPETTLRLRRPQDPYRLRRAARAAAFAVSADVADLQGHIRGAAAYLLDAAIRSRLVRCVFAFPFRQPVIDPYWLRWQAGLIPHLAGRIYADRHFDELPVLADALEEAGCTDPAVLGHLRARGPHVRGCWGVDLLTGRG